METTKEEIIKEQFGTLKAKDPIAQDILSEMKRSASNVYDKAYDQGLTAGKEEKIELYEALKMMYEQYCPGEYGHNFMSAGENAELVLERFNYLSNNSTN